MTDQASYKLLTTKEKLKHNRATSERLVFEMGGYLATANRLRYTDSWLRTRIKTSVLKQSENLLEMLNWLASESKIV